nr:MAG TPA: elongation factor [Bacteriophage sp.]
MHPALNILSIPLLRYYDTPGLARRTRGCL